MKHIKLQHYEKTNSYYVYVNGTEYYQNEPYLAIFEYDSGYYRVKGLLVGRGQVYSGWLSSKRLYNIFRAYDIDFNTKELTRQLRK